MKIGYINIFRLFDGYYKTFQKSEVFRSKKKIIDEHAHGMYVALQENEKQRRTLAENAEANKDKIREMEQQFVKNRNEFQQYVQKNNQELRRDFNQIRAEILKELHEAIKEEAANGSYELLLDVSGFSQNSVPVVLHYNKENEITEELLQKLNAGHEEEIKAIMATRLPSKQDNSAINPEISVQ